MVSRSSRRSPLTVRLAGPTAGRCGIVSASASCGGLDRLDLVHGLARQPAGVLVRRPSSVAQEEERDLGGDEGPVRVYLLGERRGRGAGAEPAEERADRKSTRLNSSHANISYA